MMLHLFAAFVAASVAVLIFVGGLVTSTGSGLSVPDWPTTYGWFMFTFPLDKMVGGIFYEHSHRLIASVVGLLIVALAICLWRAESRRWVRRLGYVAALAVVTQGILGGITVLWFLPEPVSIAHAGLAQVVFCLAVTIAVVTSPGWTRSTAATDDRRLQAIAAATTALVYVQILVGATVRHTGAGLAIPDFPLAFGRLVPPFWTGDIAVHFAHRVGAAIVCAFAVATAAHVFYHHQRRGELRRPSMLLLVLLAVQVALGAMTVLTGRQYIVNSLHVVTGALVLATSLTLTLRAYRVRLGARPTRGSEPAQRQESARRWSLSPGVRA